jgi:hypothetical protein
MRELIASEKYLLVTFLFRSGFAERFWRRVNRAAGRRWKREKNEQGVVVAAYQVAPWVVRPVDLDLNQQTVTVRVKGDRLSWLRDKARALEGEIVLKSELVGTSWLDAAGA